MDPLTKRENFAVSLRKQRKKELLKAKRLLLSGCAKEKMLTGE
jgi:hypothetical protein